jgi:reverse gyrase
MKNSYYDKFCPNCGGIISDERLKQGLPCEKCLILDNNAILSTNSNLPNWLNYVNRINFKNLSNIKNFFDEVERFTDFFYQIT